jgi:hypothetical protein
MAPNGNVVDAANVKELIRQLLDQGEEDDLTYRTRSRWEYDALFSAAEAGLFPELLSITRKGLRLNKRLIHTPLAQTHHP